MKANDAIKRNRRGFLRAAAATLVLGGLPAAARAAAAAAGKMKIGIVGSGRVGGTLGEIWVKTGHQVMFSSLDLEHDKALAARLGPNARAGTPREAAAFGDALLISVPYGALPQVGKDLADLIKGKVVIDTCNPFPGRDGEIANWARQKGAGLASAELLPGARLVRAFNAVGYARLPEAAQRAQRGGMPIAGDDANAIAVASRLVRDIERPPEEIRKIAAALK